MTETEIRDAVEVLRGVAGPQQGLLGLAAGEGMARFLTDNPEAFWLGVHGGAGENTMADLLGGVPCHHRWPSRSDTDPTVPPADVFLVARQNHRGLKAAQLAARDWAAGSHPTITLRGLVVIADAPGRTPKVLHNQTRITAGGVPQTWVLPWIEELRLDGAVDPESLTREPRKVLTSLSEVIDTINSGRN
ncbi:hypothetical protein PTW37_17435 (plasmid) [Arthrobacter agilis]|uniref:DUF6668 family protein n=1 Tax=Arthrobacter agilis TaxID=37921 RepID=UPI00236539EA|nr:DUF6668 family protein [Arthrobacter agilis]WDF35180.1 hypothetical protein PTW37_17435 [Arthrobacter agilis]